MKQEKTKLFELAVRHIVGETSEGENMRVKQLLESSGDFKFLYEELETYWSKSEHYTKEFSPDTANAFNRVLEQIKKQHEIKKQSRAILWKVAASVVLFIGLGIAMYHVLFPNGLKRQEYVSNDTTTEILLPDNTMVYLNCDSKLILALNFNRNTRKVMLEGEGYFSVTKNPEKPFIIDTRYTRTKVLGTSFNINENEDSTIIDVYSGKVLFASGKSNIILNKGNAGTYNGNNKTITKRKDYNLNANAWVTRKLIFDNIALHEVLETLSNTFQIEFSLEQGFDITDICFTGHFDQIDCENILDIIALTLNLSIEKTGENRYLVKKLK